MHYSATRTHVIVALYCVQSMTSYSISTHAGTTQILADHSLAIMDALFAPFDEATFPRQLSVPQLTNLLESPLATRVPLPPSTFQSVHQLYPDLFVQETTASAPLLAPTLVRSLQTPWPTGSPTELLYTPFWATVGYGLPELIGRQLGLNISESRCVALGRVICLKGASPQLGKQ